MAKNLAIIILSVLSFMAIAWGYSSQKVYINGVECIVVNNAGVSCNWEKYNK